MAIIRKLLIVGCGNMGFAMLKGWLEAPDAPVVFARDSPSDRASTDVGKTDKSELLLSKL